LAFLTQLGDFDPGALGMLQRILLVSDGTLTDTLEAAMLEPIHLSKVSVDVLPAPVPVPSLELDAGRTIMDRKILLFGATTGRNYVYAESQLAVERLPEDFRRELIESDKPMGRLWSEFRLETWKELLFVAREPVARLAAYFPYATHEDLLSRHYRLISGGRPLMVINEYFPAAF
jgi:chorismate-pyruvate lyase